MGKPCVSHSQKDIDSWKTFHHMFGHKWGFVKTFKKNLKVKTKRGFEEMSYL
jgi:hypothetical protein